MAARPEAAGLTQLAGAIGRGPRVAGLRALGEGINTGRRVAQLRIRGAAGGPGGPALNDDPGLEREADVMGAAAARHGASDAAGSGPVRDPAVRPAGPAGGAVVQAVGNRLFDALSKMSDRLAEPDSLSLDTHQSVDFAARSLAHEPGYEDDSEEEEEEDSDFEDEFNSDRILGRDGRLDRGPDSQSGEDMIDEERVHGGSASTIEGERGRDFEEEDLAYDDDEHQPVGAYIVNAILPYREVDRIPEVVEAMLAGLHETHKGRVAIVLGINAPDDSTEALAAAMERAGKYVDGLAVPIGLVESTFRAGGKFPYGTMRNQVMHSAETRAMTDWFVRMGLHPYISFQDFDTGSRRVGSEEGPHVFDAVDRILAGRPLETGEDDPSDPIRPLMIAGGYRPGSQEALVESTWARVQDNPIKGMTRKKVEEDLAGFEASIAEDMEARDLYAELDPLLPYAPEPNLFVDATAAAIPSPVRGIRLEFGADGAEYTALGKHMARYAAEELETFHGKQLPVGNVDRYRLDKVRGDLMVHAQTNRHPVRGRTFHTDFQNLSVVTDLSRLAYGTLRGEKPQSHVGLGQVTDRYFDSKSDKRGASFADILAGFNKQKAPQEFMNRLYVHEGGEPSAESKRYFRTNKAKLGGLARQEMSGALHRPFSNPAFDKLEFGTSPEQAMHFAQQVALQAELKRRKAAALRQSVQDEARRMGVAAHYEIGHADGGDRNCSILSIFAAAGIPIGRQDALAYRLRLAREFPIGLAEDIELKPPIAARILEFVAEKGAGDRALYSLEEAPDEEDEDGGATYRSVHLAGEGPPIFIFFAGNHFSPAWHQ